MIARLLTFGWPGAKWGLRGDHYESLQWDASNVDSKPTLEAIQGKQAEYEAWLQKEAVYAAAVAAGFPVPGMDFSLRLGDADRIAFNQMLALVREALDLGMIDNNTPQTIADTHGQTHVVTTLQFRQIMVGYGSYYKSLWDQLVTT
jgi:hypothetical protein